MNTGRLFWGVTLIVAGILLILDRMDVVDFGDLLRTYWPLLLVIWGLLMIVRRGRQGESPGAPAGGAGSSPASADISDPNHLNTSSVFGDASFRIDSKQFRGGSASSVFGDMTIDLRESALAEGEHRLRVSGVFGDARVLLPHDLAVVVTSSTVFGDLRINEQTREGLSPSLAFESPGFGSAPSRLRIEASQVFGDVTIQS